MGLRSTIFAATYDRLSRANEEAGLHALREDLLAGGSGSLLEIGAGTGANLPLYHASLERLVVAEPEEAMLRRLREKAREFTPEAEIVQAPAEALPFDDDSFDTVVSTLVRCGVDDLAQALCAALRFCRPGCRA